MYNAYCIQPAKNQALIQKQYTNCSHSVTTDNHIFLSYVLDSFHVAIKLM